MDKMVLNDHVSPGKVQAEVFSLFGQYGERPDYGQLIKVESSDQVGILRLEFSHPLQQQEDTDRPQLVLLMSRQGLIDLAHKIIRQFDPPAPST